MPVSSVMDGNFPESHLLFRSPGWLQFFIFLCLDVPQILVYYDEEKASVFGELSKDLVENPSIPRYMALMYANARWATELRYLIIADGF